MRPTQSIVFNVLLWIFLCGICACTASPDQLITEGCGKAKATLKYHALLDKEGRSRIDRPAGNILVQGVEKSNVVYSLLTKYPGYRYIVGNSHDLTHDFGRYSGRAAASVQEDSAFTF